VLFMSKGEILDS